MKGVWKGRETERHKSRLWLKREDALRVLRHTKEAFSTGTPRAVCFYYPRCEERSYSLRSHSLMHSGKFHCSSQCWYCSCGDAWLISQMSHSPPLCSSHTMSWMSLRPVPSCPVHFYCEGTKAKSMIVTALNVMSLWQHWLWESISPFSVTWTVIGPNIGFISAVYLEFICSFSKVLTFALAEHQFRAVIYRTPFFWTHSSRLVLMPVIKITCPSCC